MNKRHEHRSTAGSPASTTYEAAFEQDLASMTIAEFLRWNPRFTEAQARARIAAAEAKVARLKHKQLTTGVFDTRDRSPAGTLEEPAKQMQTIERGQADIALRTPEQ